MPKVTKAQILGLIDSRVIKTIKVEAVTDDTEKIAVGVQPYVVNVMQSNTKGGVDVVNIVMYVVDEGTDDESAYLADPARLAPDQALVGRALAYMATLPYERVKVEQINVNEEYIVCSAFEKHAGEDGIVDKFEIMVYVDTDGNDAHKRIQS